MHENNAYWVEKENIKNGLYCTRCWDADKQLMRMHPRIYSKIFYECKNCNSGCVKINSHYGRMYQKKNIQGIGNYE